MLRPSCSQRRAGLTTSTFPSAAILAPPPLTAQAFPTPQRPLPPFWSLPSRDTVTSSRRAPLRRPWRCSRSAGGRRGAGLRPCVAAARDGLLVGRFRYVGEEEEEDANHEAQEERARTLLERLREQAKARQLRRQRELGGAGPEDGAAEGKRNVEGAAQGREGLRKECEGGSAVLKRKREREPGPAAGNGDTATLTAICSLSNSFSSRKHDIANIGDRCSVRERGLRVSTVLSCPRSTKATFGSCA